MSLNSLKAAFILSCFAMAGCENGLSGSGVIHSASEQLQDSKPVPRAIVILRSVRDHGVAFICDAKRISSEAGLVADEPKTIPESSFTDTVWQLRDRTGVPSGRVIKRTSERGDSCNFSLALAENELCDFQSVNFAEAIGGRPGPIPIGPYGPLQKWGDPTTWKLEFPSKTLRGHSEVSFHTTIGGNCVSRLEVRGRNREFNPSRRRYGP
jgi:predicted small secreted protein